MLSDEEIDLLATQLGFPQERCINYLTPDEAHEEMRAAWQNRKYIINNNEQCLAKKPLLFEFLVKL